MKDFIQNQGENQENLKISFGVFRNAPQRSAVCAVGDFGATNLSPVTNFDASDTACLTTKTPMAYDRLLGAGALCFQSFFLSICYFVSVCRGLGQTHSLTSFGFSVGSCGLAMCVTVKRSHFNFHLILV